MRTVTKLLLIIILLSGCVKSNSSAEYKNIKLPVTSDKETSFSYGSPKNSYIRIKENPNQDSKSLAMLWSGNIFEIFTKTEDNWYMIRFKGTEGWVFGSEIILYEDLQKAEYCVKLTHE